MTDVTDPIGAAIAVAAFVLGCVWRVWRMKH